ncbi:15605_t:CDS:2, partial [Gigaspora rosea]
QDINFSNNLLLNRDTYLPDNVLSNQDANVSNNLLLNQDTNLPDNPLLDQDTNLPDNPLLDQNTNLPDNPLLDQDTNNNQLSDKENENEEQLEDKNIAIYIGLTFKNWEQVKQWMDALVKKLHIVENVANAKKHHYAKKCPN